MARPTRSERKDQTRRDLVSQARRVFLQRGFHAASLEEIAEGAGYSKGAIYSNFGGKDEVFLAVLDDQYERVLRVHGPLMQDAATLEAALRAAARQLADQASRDPDWTPLLVEFWTHASRRFLLRDEVRKRHEQQLDGVAAILSGLAKRHGVEFLVPSREVARIGTALGRGIALEHLLDAGSSAAEQFEDAFAAVVLGFTRPVTGQS